jgi:large subunit ribosomal protein L20
MPRVKRGTKARQRRKKTMKLAKGYYGRKKSNFRRGSEAVERAGVYAYRDRKAKKGEFRALWILRVNAACRSHNITYSQFMNKILKSKIALNRKMLSELAVTEPQVFESVVKQIAA